MTQTLPRLTGAATRWLIAGCVALGAALSFSSPLRAGDDPAAAEIPAEKKPQEPGGKDAGSAAGSKLEGAKPDTSKSDASRSNTSESEETVTETGRSPAAVLKTSRDKLLTFRSIKAKILQTVAIGTRRFKAEGTYIQGSNLRLRLEFTVKSGELTGTLLEVCDGQVLWNRYTVGGTSRITRRDVRQILDAARSAPQSPENVLISELGLGGLPALMASVEQSMKFRTVREEEIDGQKFVVLEGGWGQKFMDEWKRSNPKSPDRLSDHIPDSLRLYLDSSTLLPRRFLFLKRNPDTKQTKPMVTVDFIDLVLNAPISEDEFYFIPPDGVPQEDITRFVVEQIKGSQPAGGSLKAPEKKPSEKKSVDRK